MPRRASIGGIFAALRADERHDKNTTTKVRIYTIANIQNGTTTRIPLMSPTRNISEASAFMIWTRHRIAMTPIIVPRIIPAIAIINASKYIAERIWKPVAPILRNMPNSRVRSLADILNELRITKILVNTIIATTMPAKLRTVVKVVSPITPS